MEGDLCVRELCVCQEGVTRCRDPPRAVEGDRDRGSRIPAEGVAVCHFEHLGVFSLPVRA